MSVPRRHSIVFTLALPFAALGAALATHQVLAAPLAGTETTYEVRSGASFVGADDVLEIRAANVRGLRTQRLDIDVLDERGALRSVHHLTLAPGVSSGVKLDPQSLAGAPALMLRVVARGILPQQAEAVILDAVVHHASGTSDDLAFGVDFQCSGPVKGSMHYCPPPGRIGVLTTPADDSFPE